MNLFLYFCIPLVVTGQATFGTLGRKNQKLTRGYSGEEDSADTSETEAYSKYAYGDDVAYKNALARFAAGGRGNSPAIEDSGSIGKPNIYQTSSGTDDHPSVVSSDVYNNLKQKKINGNKPKLPRGVAQEPSPLAYDAHDQTNPALLATQYGQPIQPVVEVPTGEAELVKSHGPPVVPVEQQLVPVQDPQTGEIYYRNLIPLYQSPVPPKLSLAHQNPGVLVAAHQPFAPAKVLADHHPHHHPGVLVAPPTKVLTDPHPHTKVLAGPHPHAVYAAPPEKVLVDPHNGLYGAPPQKVLVDPSYGAPVLSKAVAPAVYDPTHTYAPAAPAYAPLLKSPVEPLYQYQTPLLKTAAPSPVLLKSPLAPAYQSLLLKEAQHLTGVEHSPYQTHLLKSADPALLKSGAPAPASYLAPLLKQQVPYSVALQGYPQAYPTLIKAYENQLLYKTLGPQAALFKTAAPAIQPGTVPLLKAAAPAHGVDARIVPAVEEHIPGLEQALVPGLAKVPVALHHQPHFNRFVPSNVLLAQKHPKAILQKAVVKDSPVYTEKAVLKAAYSPALAAYQGPVSVPIIPGVAKSPLATHYVQSSHIDPKLPSTILKSQKSLVKALITADQPHKHISPGGKTVLELVPSLSYGQQSYSLYPKENGLYGPPQPFHGYAHVDHHPQDHIIQPHHHHHHHVHPQYDHHHHDHYHHHHRRSRSHGHKRH